MSAFDPEILKRNLPEDIHEVVNQVTANVNVAVGEIIKNYENNLNRYVKQIEDKDYPADLKRELDKVEAGIRSEFSALDGQFGALQKSLEDAKKKAEASQNLEFKNAVDSFQKSAQALQTKLEETRNNIVKLGEKTGAAVATTAHRMLTGGAIG